MPTDRNVNCVGGKGLNSAVVLQQFEGEIKSGERGISTLMSKAVRDVRTLAMLINGDPVETIDEAVRWMMAFDGVLDRIGMTKLDALLKEGNAVKKMALFREYILE